MDNYQELKELALSSGATLFGIADAKELKGDFLIEPKKILEGMDFAISIGYRLSDKAIESIENEPTLLYSFHYKRVNSHLDDISLKVANHIQKKGFQSLPIPASQVVDWERQLGHLSHRKIARQAGLGWIGRSTLLINPQFGSRVRYATVLTDMPLQADKPIDTDCGDCLACIEVCPAGAIKDKKENFDRELCYKLLSEFEKRRGIGQRICGVCLKACRGKNG
jgi:epoxyqueuosine reductase QueG